MGQSHYTKNKKHDEEQNAYIRLYTFPNPKINNLFYCCFHSWVPELWHIIIIQAKMCRVDIHSFIKVDDTVYSPPKM